jgi:hypothetical protein
MIRERPLNDWTPEEAILWLEEGVRLSQYKSIFEELCLDGTMI